MSKKNTPAAPPAETTAPAEPFGTLDESEAQALAQLRQASRDITMEIGSLEIRKGRLLGNLGDLERRAQEMLANVGKRLDVPEGTTWHVTPEGNVFLGVGGVAPQK